MQGSKYGLATLKVPATTQEAKAIRTALADPTLRAFLIVVGTLEQLPSDRARARVLRFVKDRISEEAERAD